MTGNTIFSVPTVAIFVHNMSRNLKMEMDMYEQLIMTAIEKDIRKQKAFLFS